MIELNMILILGIEFLQLKIINIYLKKKKKMSLMSCDVAHLLNGLLLQPFRKKNF